MSGDSATLTRESFRGISPESTWAVGQDARRADEKSPVTRCGRALISRFCGNDCGNDAENAIVSIAAKLWCPGPESNRHALRRGILSPGAKWLNHAGLRPVFSAWDRSFLTCSGWRCGNGFCLEFTAPMVWGNLYWIPMPLTILHHRRAEWREPATSKHIVAFVLRIRALRARFRGDAVHLTALNFSALVR